MNRRSFLKTAGIILAAPAIVKAENIMKIWTPPSDLVVPDLVFLNGILQTPEEVANPIHPGNYVLSYFMKETDGTWQHHQEIHHYDKPPKELKIMFPRQFSKPPKISVSGIQLTRL